MPQVNRYNFLRWTTDTRPYAGHGDDAVPRAYLVDRERCGYMPVLYANDELSFYINAPNGVDFEDFSDLRLRIINAATSADASGPIGVLSQDVITTEAYNIYGTFTVPDLADGVYRLEIYRQSDPDAVLLASNEMIARSDDQVQQHTVLARFRNGRQFYRVRYQEIDPEFYQQFRLNISQIERQYETDKEVYTTTAGKQRTYENKLRRYVKFETYDFDPMAHEAAAVMVEHDFCEFNGERYRHKTPYKESSDPRAKNGKGEFEMYDEAFGLINQCAVGPTLLLGDGQGAYITDGNANGFLVR